MPEQIAATQDHPSPHRHRVATWALLAAVAAAPIAWAAQLTIDYALASHACYPGWRPLAAPILVHLGGLLMAVNLLAVVAALWGAFRSIQYWRATARERTGDVGHAVEAGEGRTRFLALWGAMAGFGFLAAILFVTIALIIVPPCPG